MKLKGVNPLDNSLDNLSIWKTSILKAFKSELVLIAMSNILRKKLGEFNDPVLEDFKEYNDDEKKVESEQSSDSMSLSESDLDNKIEKEKDGEDNKVNRENKMNKIIEDDFDENDDLF